MAKESKMSRIEELKQRKSELEEQLPDLKQRGEEWSEKLQEARADLKQAVINGNATYKKSSKVREAELSIEFLGDAYREAREELEQVSQQIAELQYDDGEEKLLERRAEIFRQMVGSNQRVVEVAEEEFEKQLGLAADYNAKVSSFNARVANRAGRNRLETISNLSAYELETFVGVLLRTYILEGEAGISEPVSPIPGGGKVHVPLPWDRRVEE